jgi:hypothetical protein
MAVNAQICKQGKYRTASLLLMTAPSSVPLTIANKHKGSVASGGSAPTSLKVSRAPRAKQTMAPILPLSCGASYHSILLIFAAVVTLDQVNELNHALLG